MKVLTYKQGVAFRNIIKYWEYVRKQAFQWKGNCELYNDLGEIIEELWGIYRKIKQGKHLSESDKSLFPWLSPNKKLLNELRTMVKYNLI